MNQAQRGTRSSTLTTKSSVLSVLRQKKKKRKEKSRCFTSSFAKRALQALQTVWLLWWLNQQEILGGEIWAKPCAWSEYSNFSVWVILKHFFWIFNWCLASRPSSFILHAQHTPCPFPTIWWPSEAPLLLHTSLYLITHTYFPRSQFIQKTHSP